MTDNLRDIAIALCMETSEKNNVNRPLTIAKFYKLLSAIERYNDNNSSSAQVNLFEQNHRYDIEFAYLRDIEADFMAQDLGGKGRFA